MRILGWMVAGIAVALLAAGLRTAVEHLLRSALGVPAALLQAARDGAVSAQHHVSQIVVRGRAGLAYGDPQVAGTGWDLAGPLVYLLLFTLIALGDLVLAGLRFGALLGIPVDGFPIPGGTLDLLAGVLFLAVLTTYGCVLLDTAHVTPLHRPFGLITGRTRKIVLGIAGAGSGLSCLAAVLFFVWGQYAVLGEPNSDAALLFVAVFALLLVGASVLAAGGAIGAVAVLWVLVCALTAAGLAIAGWLCSLVIAGLNALHRLAVAAVRLLAKPGALVWNWLAGLGVGRSLHLSALAEPDGVADLLQPRRATVDLAAGEPA